MRRKNDRGPGRENNMEKKKNRKALKTWQKLVLGLIATVLAAVALELYCNRGVLGLPSSERGIHAIEEEMITAQGFEKTEEGYRLGETGGTLRLEFGGSYVEKLCYTYDHESIFNVLVTVQYQNAYGQAEIKQFYDKNSAVISRSVINLGKKIDWIELHTEQGLLDQSGVGYEAGDPYEAVITGIFVKNQTQVNLFRILFVFLAGCLIVCGIVFRKKFGQKLEWAFLAVSLTAGVFMIACLPATKVGWDEETHFMRSYQLSLYPGGQQVTPEVRDLFVCGLDTWPLNLPDSMEEKEEVNEFFLETCKYNEGTEVAVGSHCGIYTPGYFGSAIFLKVGRIFHMPFTMLYQFGRLGNLLVYCFLMALAIRLLPVGKRILMAVALMPTPMFLAACYSYDPSVFAFSMVGFALVLREILDSERTVSWKPYLAALFCFAWGILPKAVYAPLALTGLLIPASRYRNKKEMWIMRAGFVLLFLFLMSSFVLPSLLSPSSYGDTRGGAVSVGTQMKNVLFRPLTYTEILLMNIWKSLPSYLMGDGIFLSMGHLGLAGFGSVTLLYTCGVMLTEDQSMRSKTFSKWQKLGLLVIVVFTVALIWTAFYLTFTVPGSTWIQGVQGRYFLPVLLPLFLVCGCRWVKLQVTEQTKNLLVMSISGFLIYAMIWSQLIIGRNW